MILISTLQGSDSPKQKHMHKKGYDTRGSGISWVMFQMQKCWLVNIGVYVLAQAYLGIISIS